MRKIKKKRTKKSNADAVPKGSVHDNLHSYDSYELIEKYFDPCFEQFLVTYCAANTGSVICDVLVDFRETLAESGTCTEDDLREFARGIGSMLSAQKNPSAEKAMRQFLKKISKGLGIEVETEFKTSLKNFSDDAPKDHRILFMIFFLVCAAIVSAVFFEHIVHSKKPVVDGAREISDAQAKEDVHKNMTVMKQVPETIDYGWILGNASGYDGEHVEVRGFLLNQNIDAGQGTLLPEYYVVDDSGNKLRLSHIKSDHRKFFLLDHISSELYAVNGTFRSGYDLEIEVDSIRKTYRSSVMIKMPPEDGND